ncbi:hypothetical protein QR680_005212 [Steinernema hermaphroditum]|uniref:EF-hand domain-containing protein n=1 Tax=Steinernema hermaphroditum TaxID=289476 RepID=A0AA39LV91_9BILA|nr:hypothetical protein QR680_005212 [Steinernema hermaphroditum]
MNRILLCAFFAVGALAQTPLPPMTPETVEESFKRIDSDGDGSLSFDEFLRMSKTFSDKSDAEFKEVDTNGDGKVVVDELKAFEKKRDDEQLKNHMDDSARFFKGFDADKSNFLEVAEIANFLETERRVKVKGALGEVIKPFDKNGDGKLDVNEFNDFLTHFPFDNFESIPQGH